MRVMEQTPALCLVWQPSDFADFWQKDARDWQAGNIVDLSGSSERELFDCLQRYHHVDFKISYTQLILPGFQNGLRQNSKNHFWIEYFPEFYDDDFPAILHGLKVVPGIQYTVITGDLSCIEYFFKNKIHTCNLALKGSEAAGFVGTETLLTLITYIEQLASRYSFRPLLAIWGGVATPEAVVALSDKSSISYVVFESLHWLTDDLQKDYPHAVKRLKSLRMEHIACIKVSARLFFRAYNKGNNQVYSSLLMGEGDDEEQMVRRRVSALNAASVHPLLSNFSNQECVPIGIEAAFADFFRQQFGGRLKQALVNFSEEIARCIALAPQRQNRFLTSGITSELGICYPFIQGAMACISDVPAFSRAVATAGGLPTIALGMQSVSMIEEKYAGLKEQMQGLPYAVNIIALPENPHRDEQLAWILRHRPPFVVISAGDPAFAIQLQQQGIQVLYVTSDIDLLQLAWQRGIKYVVIEGQEAGGHVGEFSLLTLSQAALTLKYRHPESVANGHRLILAGGVCNTPSLKRAVLLGADAVQMGTAYLTTSDIVAEKALSPLYQKMVLNAAVGDTTITGETVGLRVRSLLSPKIKKLLQLEKEFKAVGSNTHAIRERIERESGGSLYLAARGKDPFSGRAVEEQECLQQGQFMCGAIAGVITEVQTVDELHRQLVEGLKTEDCVGINNQQAVVLPKMGPGMKGHDRVAITGVAIANALGNCPEEVWQKCRALQSGIIRVPLTRWDHNRYFTRSSNYKGKTYCDVGAFLSLDISRKDLGISPHDFRTMTDSTKLTLWLAEKAIADAGLLSGAVDKGRIGVIVAQNSGEMGSTTEDLTASVLAEEIAAAIQQQLGLEPTKKEEIINIIKAGRISIDDTTLLGRLNCSAGGFICNKYGFTGPSYSVSAACATGLVALYNAIQLLRNDILDIAIVGGGEELLHPASFLEFSALGALAGRNYNSDEPATTSRPFDQQRDGMILGEGGAMLVIERESSAINRKRPIYAFITGVGASNNHQGMVESVAETQQLAISASFADSGYGPDQVDMIECHATATPTGDIEEVKALKAIYPQERSVVLSSFKSQIGHTLGTSGLNSLIRGVWAMRAGVFPPTLNYSTPDPQLDLESWGFKVCKKPEPWPRMAEKPRRFQVNAFGFGGANYVVQLEESKDRDQVPVINEVGAAVRPTGQDISNSLGIGFFATEKDSRTWRIGAFHPPCNKDNVAAALKKYSMGAEWPNELVAKKLAKDGLVASALENPPPLALIFAGQGTHYSRMGRDLYETFPAVRIAMEQVAKLADFDILHMLFHEEEANLRKTVWQQPALFVLEYAIIELLRELKIQPVAMAGHSMGELTALAVAGCFTYEDAFRIISKRASCMEKAGQMAADPGAMLAVDAPEELLRDLLSAAKNLYFTNFNSPHQIVIGGGTKEIEALKQKLDALKYWNRQLAVSMAFHSPIMRIIRDDLGDYLAGIDFQPPKIPVISNTTGRPYPNNPQEIKAIIISHLESPVHWRENITTLWHEFGVRSFVEIGPQDTLCKLLYDTLPDAQAMHTCYPKMEAETLRRTIATLYVQRQITPPVSPMVLDLSSVAETAALSGRVRDENVIRAVIQREINVYALNGVEKYLRPALLRALQQEVDPSFRDDDLTPYLGATATAVAFPAVVSKAQATVDIKEKTSGKEVPVRDNPILEKVIAIIMEATGYEREELEPDMDIRQDLSIRSSRLPIIMDAAEQAFHIVIKLEEFIDVRTIGDLADRIEQVVATQGASSGGVIPDRLRETLAPTTKRTKKTEKALYPIKRMVFGRQEIIQAEESLLPNIKGGHVLVVQLGAGFHAQRVGEQMAQDYTMTVSHLAYDGDGGQSHAIDFNDLHKVEQILEELSSEKALSGVIFVSGKTREKYPSAEALKLFTGIFSVLQSFLQSSAKAFCLHYIPESEGETVPQMVAEAIHGMFLCAKIEYQSLLFRSVWQQDGTEIGMVLKTSLNPNITTLDLLFAGGHISTTALVRQALGRSDKSAIEICADDVIIITGGGRGVTSFLAKALASYGCRLILLGRSPYFEGVDASADKDSGGAAGSAAIAATLQAIRENGGKAEYICCDIADREQVARVQRDIRERYGRIDGVVHGAGVLQDGFIQILSAADFSKVVAVKYLGLVHVIEMCSVLPRFVVGLSSIAAITGNVGQTNYCCGNRAMAAYLENLQIDNPSIVTKTFWLPPIEGVGMAEDPDLKEIIKMKVGEHAFLDVEEMAALFCRELFCGGSEGAGVIAVRQLPKLPSLVCLDNGMEANGDWFDCTPYPMIDKVQSVDLVHNKYQAQRVFNQEKDLWLNDHKPFAWLEYPIVSAVMIIETFIETARLFCAEKNIYEVRNIKLLRMFEVPPNEGATAHLNCLVGMEAGNRSICQIDFGKLVQQDTGNTSQQTNYFHGEVVLESSQAVTEKPSDYQDIVAKSRDTVMTKEDIHRYYAEHSNLVGRYRVLDSIASYSAEAIYGRMVYPDTLDFAGATSNNYLYPLYLLEGLQQLVTFHTGIRDGSGQRAMVPTAIQSLKIFRNCDVGEKILLVGRRTHEDKQGITWRATGYSVDGDVVLDVAGLRMNWLE